MGKKKKKKDLEVKKFDWVSYRKTWRTFGGHLRPYWPQLTLAITGLVLSILAELARPWPLKMVLDHVLLERPLPQKAQWLLHFGSGEMQLLVTLCVGIVVIVFINAIVGFMNKYLMTVVGESVAVDVRERIFVHLQALSLNFHEKSRSGDLVFRMTSDIGKLKKLLIDSIQNFGSHSLKFLGIISTMLYMDWQLCLVAMTVIPILYFATHFFAGNVKKYQTEKRSRESNVASIVQENMMSISLIQAYSAEENERKRFQKQNKKSLTAQLKTNVFSKLFKRAVQMMIATGTAFVVYFGARKVIGGDMSPGDLYVFTVYLKELYGPIDKFSDMLIELAQSMVSGERLVELVEQPVVIEDAPDAKPAPAFKGDVEFRNVSFHYKKGQNVLIDLNLHTKPGQMVAIVGSSGAGKSTLANLLLRFYDPTEGKILIDGTDIRKFTVASLREQITVLLQDTFLFRKSVRGNLSYGREDATEEEIVAAAKAAQAHDFIMDLPQGYDTLIEEGGVNFSGGQKQRLNIARAILRDSPILILDEPTTGLDALAEAQINQALTRLTQGRTTFVIAHRFSTVMNADHILLIEEGKISEEGSHEELLKHSATYRKLWQLQYGSHPTEDQAG